jgi:hypothetical protein
LNTPLTDVQVYLRTHKEKRYVAAWDGY